MFTPDYSKQFQKFMGKSKPKSFGNFGTYLHPPVERTRYEPVVTQSRREVHLTAQEFATMPKQVVGYHHRL